MKFVRLEGIQGENQIGNAKNSEFDRQPGAKDGLTTFQGSTLLVHLFTRDMKENILLQMSFTTNL